jgi:hypothetical protein
MNNEQSRVSSPQKEQDSGEKRDPISDRSWQNSLTSSMMLSSNILPLPLLLLCSVPILASTTPKKLILNSDSRYQLAVRC